MEGSTCCTLIRTQRAENLARTPQERTILEQSATVLLLREEPEGLDACKEIYKLIDSEVEYLVNAPTKAGFSKRGEEKNTSTVSSGGARSLLYICDLNV